MKTNGEQPAERDPVPEGVGALFQDGHKHSRGDIRHLRSDARMAARILSCGVVEPEQMKALMSGMFSMAAREMAKETPSVRNITALLRIFEVAAKLEQDERKLLLASEQGTPPEGYTGVGSMPVIEVVVKNRDEVHQFSDIRDQLVETLNHRRINDQSQVGRASNGD